MPHLNVTDPEKLQNSYIEKARNDCIQQYGEGALVNWTKPIKNDVFGLHCPAFWDTIICWPPTPINKLATIQCPTNIVGFDKTMNNATRHCTSTGQWYIHDELNTYWSNYTQCYASDRPTVWMEMPTDLHRMNGSLTEGYVPLLKIMSRVGYGVSLCTLIVAFTIMFSIKRLHCPRNKLHMNLFASFIFRAFISILKDLIFVEGVGPSSLVKEKNGDRFYFEDTESTNWNCKLVTSLWEFFITANYSWILMEGLYLHNLIFRALFTDSTSKITHYILIGWGLPILVIVSWIITRLTLEDTLCWTTHHSTKAFLIIRIPTTISILINLILFVRIAVVLFSKLRSALSEEAQRYQKWARSTLVLVPLFGVHYAIFLGMSYYMGKNEIIELTWLTCDQLFGSFQGFFVAILYCFLNGEVRAEVKPYIHALCMTCMAGLCSKCCTGQGESLRNVSRSSVCTMISSSSLHNGVGHHKYKVKWDCFPHHKNCHEKHKTHMCYPKMQSWQDISPRRYRNGNVRYSGAHPYFSNGSIQASELTALNGEQKKERCNSEPQLGIEMMNMIEKQT